MKIWLMLLAALLLVVGGSLDARAKKGRSGHDDQREVRISHDSGHHGRRHGGEDDSGHHGRHGQGEIEVQRSSGHR